MQPLHKKPYLLICCALLIGLHGWGSAASAAQVSIDFSRKLGPLKINHMALGQGGLAPEPMWADRIPEIRILRPAIIRLFIQEYFRLLPEPGRHDFTLLDRAVDAILQTGAKPVMCICFKPRALYPQINQDIVEPDDYAAWEALIEAMVKHYRERQAGIRFWEVGNEVDIGESGGCPYRFKPEAYVRYYGRTAAAILRGDPEARVGGPALANVRSPILPALLAFCRTNQAPLHFVSWHIYSSDPAAVRGTIDFVNKLLADYPGPRPETMLNEWNMDLMNPPLDPRFQPCYIAEVIWQMKEAGLDYSCYYHVRDWYVTPEQFAPFMSPEGTAFMTRWWNRMPQFDGLFDYQNRVRPSYFTFKLVGRLAGDRLALGSDHPNVHGLATRDDYLRMENVLVWNYSSKPVAVELACENLPAARRVRHVVLDAVAGSDDENARLRPEPFVTWKPSLPPVRVQLEPWAVHYWSLE